MIMKYLKTEVQWILETSCLLSIIRYSGPDSRVRLFRQTDISETDSVSIIRVLTLLNAPTTKISSLRGPEVSICAGV